MAHRSLEATPPRRRSYWCSAPSPPTKPALSDQALMACSAVVPSAKTLPPSRALARRPSSRPVFGVPRWCRVARACAVRARTCWIARPALSSPRSTRLLLPCRRLGPCEACPCPPGESPALRRPRWATGRAPASSAALRDSTPRGRSTTPAARPFPRRSGRAGTAHRAHGQARAASAPVWRSAGRRWWTPCCGAVRRCGRRGRAASPTTSPANLVVCLRPASAPTQPCWSRCGVPRPGRSCCRPRPGCR